jgi:ABC-type multidrug transport system ATPase subunit
MLKKNKVTILLSTHNLDLTEELSDYRLELDEVGDYKFIQVKK